MLSARAYSFRQKSQLAISLSWIGGYINAIAFAACGALVSHMTGNTTMLARWSALGAAGDAVFFGLLVAAFFAGAIVSSVMMELARRRGSRSKFVLPLCTEAILLGWFMVGMRHFPSATAGVPRYELVALAAFLMGLQNATITKISGAVVRSTHMTGVVTDLAIETVQFTLWCVDELRGRSWSRAGRIMRASQRHPTALRLLLLISIYGSFIFGAIIGTLLYGRWSYEALLVPAGFLMVIVLIDWMRPIADIRELDLLRDPELRLDAVITRMLTPHIVVYRGSCQGGGVGLGGLPHRAPDFQLWLDRVPPKAKIVILALSPLTRFDANAVMDLELAVQRLHRSHRKLILSGVTPKQVRALDELGVARMMDVNNIIPDLELAIARSISLLQAEGLWYAYRTPAVTASAPVSVSLSAAPPSPTPRLPQPVPVGAS